jgi:phosphatidylglycerol:prolipoprotein diacylglycerol transferase
MGNELLHIYGPFSIRSYGLMIAIGLALFVWLLQKHPKYKALTLGDKIIDITIVGIIAGLLGGRILFGLSQPEEISSLSDFFSFWNGGFSILGCVLGVLCSIPLYLYYLHVPIIPFLDLIALYAPLLQSISRVGCFFAGCCYGHYTQLPWGVRYTDPYASAPLGICIHPTQLYSSLLLLIIFLGMYYILQNIYTKPGQLTALYLFFIALERFTIDFWRADTLSASPFGITVFSLHQWIALIIAGASAGSFIAITASSRLGSTQQS